MLISRLRPTKERLARLTKDCDSEKSTKDRMGLDKITRICSCRKVRFLTFQLGSSSTRHLQPIAPRRGRRWGCKEVPASNVYQDAMGVALSSMRTTCLYGEADVPIIDQEGDP